MPRENNRQTPPAPAALTPTAAPGEQYEKIMAAIERDRDKLVRTLAATNIKPERFLTVVDQALRRSPDLLACTPASVLKALLDAAELGLVPSGLVGSAYLVPYRNKNTHRLEAQLIPGYRGLIDLCRRSGELRSIEARMVRENDDFEIIFGTDGYVRHVPYINRTHEMEEFPDPQRPDEMLTKVKDGGRYIGAYCIARLPDGAMNVEWMATSEIDAIRARSKAAASGPWVTDYGEMGKKTVTRRTVKYLPISIDSLVNRALALEDEAEERSSGGPTVAVKSAARRALEGALGITAEEEATTEGAEAQEAAETEQEATTEQAEGGAE